jgi:lysozyme
MGNKAIIIGAIIFLLLFMTTKSKAAELIKRFEGIVRDKKDPAKIISYQDSANIWTIGYGSTRNPYTGEKVKQGQVIDEKTALDWLQQDIKTKTAAIKKLIKVPVTTNMLDSLTSFAYNVGLGAFQRSTLLRLLNEKAPKQQIADQFLRWNKVNGQVVRGLTIRRELERKLFLS